MAKRVLFIGISLVILTLAMMAQAQDATPDSQATVDAAVSTLIAQTQQAPQMLMTQTIQAALAQALTATAQPPIAAATEQPFDALSLRIAGTTDLDLLAGPGSTSAYLAPDGEHFAYLKGRVLCIYAQSVEQNCTDLTDTVHRIDTESIRWSPDSRYLALTEEFFRSFTEPDIWVFDTTTSALTDITDDGVAKIALSGGDWTNIDLIPHWTSDGQIVFLRYNRLSGEVMPPEIYQIAPDGSGETLLGSLSSTNDPFSIYNFDISGDSLIYAYSSQSGSPSDGVWISDLDGTNAHQLTHTPREGIISSVKASPDGRYVLVSSARAGLDFNFSPEVSRFYTVDTTTGAVSLINPDRFVSGAGWSPTGSALVYITHEFKNQEADAVFLTNTPGVAGEQLTSLTGTFNIATPLLQQTLGWGANNTVLLSHSPTTGIVLVHLE